MTKGRTNAARFAVGVAGLQLFFATPAQAALFPAVVRASPVRLALIALAAFTLLRIAGAARRAARRRRIADLMHAIEKDGAPAASPGPHTEPV